MGAYSLFILVSILVCYSSVSSLYISYQFPEQWKAWKTEHGKNYSSELEDLDRHLVWLSNKKFIESHNSFSHVFGYTLALNKFADMVRKLQLLCENKARNKTLQKM